MANGRQLRMPHSGRVHESTKEDRLFGTDYKTMGYQREVVSTAHDAAIWIIYRSRLSIIMDNAQPSEIALAEQLGHEMQKIVRSKWWSTFIKDKKEDFQELWCKGSWIQVQGDEISFNQNTQLQYDLAEYPTTRILKFRPLKALAYADYLTVGVVDQQDADHLFQILDIYSRAADAKVNINKTEAVALTLSARTSINPRCEYIPAGGIVTCLGIPIYLPTADKPTQMPDHPSEAY
ncbi:uncharacterized protein VTP21DRAFT_10807 [Calcarisporiella thermophila]|uniref:uncharacterized protein n=1 Tax=Calcarisporiella thermophila TaxID=911321 RepID=UPI003744290D